MMGLVYSGANWNERFRQAMKTFNEVEIEKCIEIKLAGNADFDIDCQDIRWNDYSGSTPLGVAVHFGRVGIVACLLRGGANPDVLNPVRALPGYRTYGIEDNIRISPLYEAIEMSRQEIFDLLLPYCKNPDLGSQPSGMTPAMLAALNCESALLESLLLAGSSVDAVSRNNNTALHWTISRLGNSEESMKACVTILLQHGADPNAGDSNGWTFLHHASTLKNVVLVELAIKYGADTNIKTFRGETAKSFGNEEIFSILEREHDPVSVAQGRNRRQSCIALSRFCFNLNKVMMSQIRNIHVENDIQKEKAVSVACLQSLTKILEIWQQYPSVTLEDAKNLVSTQADFFAVLPSLIQEHSAEFDNKAEKLSQELRMFADDLGDERAHNIIVHFAHPDELKNEIVSDSPDRFFNPKNLYKTRYLPLDTDDLEMDQEGNISPKVASSSSP